MSDVIDKLERLSVLFERGFITKEEFEEQKRRILSGTDDNDNDNPHVHQAADEEEDRQFHQKPTACSRSARNKIAAPFLETSGLSGSVAERGSSGTGYVPALPTHSSVDRKWG